MGKKAGPRAGHKAIRKLRLPRLFDDAMNPVAVINGELQLVYLNEAACDFFSVAADDGLGQQLRYSSANADPDRELDPLSGLCPNPDLLEEELVRYGHVFAVSSGGTCWRSASFQRLIHADHEVLIVVIVATSDLPAPPEAVDSEVDLRTQLHQQLSQLQQPAASSGHDSSIGISDISQRLRKQLKAVAENSSDCLIIGPRGSGKEKLARGIFAARGAKNSVLVPIHCAIADSQQIQNSIKAWVFQQRESQTSDWLLLLDVDRLDVEGQSELLGFTRLPDFELRFFATATECLFQLADQKRFSRQLAMQLSVQTIELAPLEDRLGDIALLSQHFVELLNRSSGKQISGLADEAIELLCRYHWPGNLEELREYITSAFENCAGRTIGTADLPDAFRYGLTAAKIGKRESVSIQLDEYLAGIERELVQRALREAGDNRTEAARLLGISRGKLLRRIDSLLPDDSKPAALAENTEPIFREAE